MSPRRKLRAQITIKYTVEAKDESAVYESIDNKFEEFMDSLANLPIEVSMSDLTVESFPQLPNGKEA